MYTQCPECLTIYEIDEDALQASLGIVRCGRCDNRFDALRTLSDSLPVEPLSPLPEHDPIARAPTLTDVVPQSTFERAARKLRIRPAQVESEATADPGSVFPDPFLVAIARVDETADDWFTDIESELTAGALDIGADTSGAADADEEWVIDFPEPDGTTGAEPEDAAVAGPGDRFPASGGSSPLPVLAIAVAEASREAASGEPAREPATPAESGVAESDRRSGYPPVPALAPDGLEGKPEGLIADAPGAASTAVPPAAEATPVHALVYIRPRRRFSRAGMTWSAGCIMLALLFITQLAWSDRAGLLRDPATHAWMASVCRNVPCRMPLIRDIGKLELLSRDVRPDPGVKGALAITATVRNNAPFAQPWPIVVVAFTDLEDNPVAMRRFRPAEYMPGAARRAAGIAPGETAAVAFLVADPGKRAVNFQFSFQ